MRNTYQTLWGATRYAAAFLSLLLLALACEKKETIFEGPYHVRFTRSDTSVRESYTQTLRLSVHYAGPQLSTPIRVRYLVGGSAREGIDYRFVSEKGTVVIPANQSFGYIQLQLINNANNILETQDIRFTLLEAEPANVRIGFGSGEIGKTMQFTIVDECFLSGTYSGTNTQAETPRQYRGISITSTDCKEYTLTNWNLGLFGLNAVRPDLTFIDNGDNSITIPPQTESELSAPRDTISGSGFYNPLDQSLTFNVELKVLTEDGKRDSSIVLNLKYNPEK
jgi:hypothetical protein